MTDDKSDSQQLVLLPVDRARIVLPTDRSLPLLLKHIDGETIRVAESVERTQSYTIFRNHDPENGTTEDPVRGGSTIQDAITRAADMQAFGAGRGGQATDVIEQADTEFARGEMGLELRDRGGIVYRNFRNLPITLHTAEGEYWRARTAEPTAESDLLFVLEHRSETAGSWNIVETRTAGEESESDQKMVEVLADRAGIPCLNDPTAEEMRDRIDECEL